MKQINISDDAYKALVTRHGDLAAFLEAMAQKPAAQSNGGSKQQPKTLYDALVSDGMLGKYEDLPADLSTNQKYMDDFGR